MALQVCSSNIRIFLLCNLTRAPNNDYDNDRFVQYVANGDF